MAYPQFESYYSHAMMYLEATYQKVVTMPSGIVAGDLLIVACAVGGGTRHLYTLDNTSTNWITYIYSLPDSNLPSTLWVYVAKALGSGLDKLEVSFSSKFQTGVPVMEVMSFISMRISGAKDPTGIYSSRYAKSKLNTLSNAFWTVPPVPSSDDSFNSDFLYLLFSASDYLLPLSLPSGFTDYHSVDADSTGYSLSCSYMQSTSSRIVPGPIVRWAAGSGAVGIMRIPSDDYTYTPPGSTGFGIYARNGRVSIYEPK